MNYRDFVILFHIGSKVGIMLDFLKKTKFTMFHPSTPNWILYVTRPIDSSDTIVVYDLGEVNRSQLLAHRLGRHRNALGHRDGHIALGHVPDGGLRKRAVFQIPLLEGVELEVHHEEDLFL